MAESIWPEDVRLMRDAGVNLVSLGIFSWARLQSAPGVFHFEWLDRIMDLLARHDIAVDLATATAAPPAWLVRRHPDILPTRQDGSRLHHGSRQHHHPSSAAYRAACAEFVTALATRYRPHPALAMWHVNNEYSCSLPADYGEETAAAFRAWLRARYHTLEALNDAWGTAFWSQHYYDWEEIIPPRATPAQANPGQSLDFARFSSDAQLECYQLEARILKSITPETPVTTNFMGWFKPCDYRRWSTATDFACVDLYPEPDGPPTDGALNADLTRSWKDGAPWVLMEQATTHVNWRQRNATKPPGLMRRWSHQYLARGADGILFFQWRQSRAGAEKFHGAMVGHGDPTRQRCYRESCELGHELARLGEIAGSRVDAAVGLYFDYDNWWALELPGKPNNDLAYRRAVEAFYTPLHRQNLTSDFVFADSDFARYRLIFAPALYLVKPGLAEKFTAFVESGGIVVFSYFSGIVDPHDRVLLGGYPAPFRRLLGLEVEEWAVPADDRPFPLATTAAGTSVGLAPRYEGSFWAEAVRLEGAEEWVTFTHDFLAGRPALTRHRVGRGEAWYLATDGGGALHADLVRHLGAAAGVRPPVATPDGVETVDRWHPDGRRFTFLLNHGVEPAIVSDSRLRGHELLSNAAVSGSLPLAPRGVAIVRRA